MAALPSVPATPAVPAGALTLRGVARGAPLAVFHLAALAIMAWSEIGPEQIAAFLLTWGLLNCLWLALLRRPGLSAGLSLAMIVTLIALSRFKHSIVWMTASFIDVMVVDAETFSFLWSVFPKVRTIVIAAIVIAIPVAVLVWRFDPFRVRLRTSLLGAAACLAGLVGLSFAVPLEPGQMFGNENYVSVFARSGVEALGDIATRGIMESDPTTPDKLRLGMEDSCQPAGRRPHVILIHDESSFDIRAVDGIKVPDGYGGHFRSLDGRARRLLVEGAGGPSWLTEYNVMAGLSSRSFGRFGFFVTRIAAGRVERGLPHALRRCGYRTFSIYPVVGSFLGARSFYHTAGVQHFIDGRQIHGAAFEPDRFYFDNAAKMIARERDGGPMFLFVYLTANHFPWDKTFRPELTPGWRNPGNAHPAVDEYLRRQAMSERDYAEFVARLAREFPGEPFLLVRFGDHQPEFTKLIIDTSIDVEELGRRLMRFDARYFTTYYAIDAINFRPFDLGSALDVLDAPYLPLVVQEAAGVPLDATFAEQKRILQRCRGVFYACGNGAEARRFNRLLIDAGLIKGL